MLVELLSTRFPSFCLDLTFRGTFLNLLMLWLLIIGLSYSLAPGYLSLLVEVVLKLLRDAYSGLSLV